MSKISNYQAIFVDLDNTLTTRRKKYDVSVDNSNALKNFQRREKYVVISTGRHKKDFMNIWENIYLNKYCDYAIYSNGAIIENIKTGEIIYSNLISESDYNELIEYVRQNNNFLFKFAGDKILNKFGKYKFLEKTFMSTSGYEGKEFLLEDKIEVTESNRQKFGIFSSYRKSEVKKVIEELKEKFPNLEVVTSGGDLYIEITNKNVNKGTAATKLATHLNIDLSNSIAIGDSMNDYELFKIVGYPIAMKNASQELIEISKFKTTEAKRNGVATAIKNLDDK